MGKARLRRGINIIIICLLLIFLSSGILANSIAIDDQNVVISIAPKPKIDVVLAKARTKTEVSTFEKDLMDSLKNLNIDPSDVKVSAVQAQTVNMETSFSWQRDVSSSIGAINITNNGQNVEMVGNASNPGKNALWIMPTGNQEQKFNFDYTIDYGDSFNAAGMLLRVKQTGNTLTGYMLSFNKSGLQWYTDSGSQNGAIWKFTYVIGQNTTNMTKTFVKGLNISTSGNLTVSATDNEINISGGGLSSTVGYTIPENDQSIGNGFGFFSDHYSHGCSSIGSFALRNINLQTTVVRSFNEVLREPEWRDGAYKFLVNVDDNENDELKQSAAYSELLTRLLNENIYFVSWGKEKNKAQFENVIASNNGNGKFVLNTAYSSSITQTAAYIKDVVGKLMTTQSVIVNEPISITVNPAGIEKDTIDEQWPYGKWKIEHDYTYFENNIGQFAESGKYISNLITTFNKTGRYKISYKDIEISPKEIFVHRRPVAQIGMQVSGTNVTLASESYDMDKMSDNQGVSEEEWKWKASDATTWNNGKLTTIDTSKTYIVQLRVKDFQETWSTPATKYITTSASALPVAMYSIPNSTITKYDEIEINDSSYDPAGKTITSRLWEVYKNGTKIYSGATPKINYLNDGLGTYTMYLTVKNSANVSSERYSRTFEVVDDTMAPEVVATPTECEWSKNVNVHVAFSDEGGSKFRGYQYAITDSQAAPTTWNSEIKKENDDITITEEGEKYLHIIGYDNAGNASADRILGPYKIDHSGPTMKVTADLDTATTDGVVIGIKTEDLLSGVKSVTVNGKVIQTDAIKILSNGTYTIQSEDYVGNITTEEISIHNIYKVCEAGLEHPNYPSELTSCPICDLIQGLEVENDQYIYDGTQKSVQYKNPQNATIIEYYNGSKEKPVSSGEYNYELKVEYNGNEYRTGKTGTLKIAQKELQIQDISADNRQYDGTNVVTLKGGDLLGVEAGDDVSFVLSATGNIANKDIGQYFVTIPEITLSGEKAANYSLKQPQENTIPVTISSRELTISDLQVTARPYNNKQEVEITGGVLNNLLIGNEDQIGFVLNGGIARNPSVGEQIVDINKIDLTNNEKNNYILIAPDPMKVMIGKKELKIENITADNRQYDGSNVVTLKGGSLVGIEEGDDVSFVLSSTGTIPNKDVGEYFAMVPEIGLTGEKALNYSLIQPQENTIPVKIESREITISDLHATPRSYNKQKEVEITGGVLNNLLVGNEDQIGFVLNGGIARDEKVGEQVVDINKIDLSKNEKNNYILIAPDPILVQISKKELQITQVVAKDRSYDATNIVEVSGGNLVGIEEGDKVSFVLSNTGTIEDKKVGAHFVTIPDIMLEGEDSTNYQLKQLTKEEIPVQITKKDLQIQGIEAENRQYDGTNIVKVSGGSLIGIVEGDKVSFILSETGTIEQKEVGEYLVTVPEVILEGEDATNYQLKQPTKEEVPVTISKRILTIEGLKATDRQYDKTDIVQITGGVLQNVVVDEVINPVIPEKGSSQNPDIGLWNVTINPITLTGETSANYELTQPTKEEISVTISKPEQPLLHMESFVQRINEKEIQKAEPEVKVIEKEETKQENSTDETQKVEDVEKLEETLQEEKTVEKEEIQKTKAIEETVQQEKVIDKEATKEENSTKNEEKEEKIEDLKVEYTVPEMKEEIRYGDIVELKIRVYNEGKGNGYAQKIINKIPEGFEFVQKDEINKTNGWKQQDNNTVVTEILNFDSGVKNEIASLQKEKVDYREVSLVLKVVQKEAISTSVKNETTLNQVDIRQEEIALEEKDRKKELALKISYTDFAVKKEIKKIVEVRSEGNQEHLVEETSNQMTKLEVHAKKLAITKVQIVYQISVHNLGDTKGTVEKIVDNIPSGFQLDTSSQSEWVETGIKELTCETFGAIEPNQTMTKELTLTANAAKVIGTNENQAKVFSQQDIDQRVVEKENTGVGLWNSTKLSDTNNVSHATAIISIQTGENTKFIVPTITLILGGLGFGIIVEIHRKKRK